MKTRRRKGAKHKMRGLTEKSRFELSRWQLTNKKVPFFLPFDCQLWEKLHFSHNPANMSQGKQPHQSFLQWGTKRSSKPYSNRTIIFLICFLFKHIPFLNHIFHFYIQSTSVDLIQTPSKSINSAHLVQTILNKKGIFRYWDWTILFHKKSCFP